MILDSERNEFFKLILILINEEKLIKAKFLRA